ncbi:HD domain-containing protein [Chryseolinea sp. T2]|uniref:HD domain-containing protein n=1 Tax=Chryseolinea sp. T2 TaxID=3129255 RepID=UPI00307885B2
MPSILPGYEYDIFISYRLKDNRVPFSSPGQTNHGSGSGWVTGFVQNLRTEIESTFKEDISIYFDSNAHDGLLETHDVDKSLENKVKSLVFIPILSQIYCDPKSFAWQQEFCAFNRFAQTDGIGREVRLRDGNVSSRILPVMIHQLDTDDLGLIETEMQSRLRSIDFIFRSPGVNRPLMPDDARQGNTNNLSYRDQVNKVANAIKQIILAMKSPVRPGETPAAPTESAFADAEPREEKSSAENKLHEKSIAVLPFVNLSNDQSQEYFADGITENIVIQLASMSQLRVISRTSVMRYKKSMKSAPEIASELGVKYILEGSAQAHGNKVRINVQLIDALQDQHVWSRIFVESMDDIFAIQSNVAEVVANELNSSINPKQTEKLKEIPTKNLEAYDLFLKGRHAFNQWGVNGYRAATEYYKHALAKDPDFKQAYSALASSYSARMSWNGDLSPDEAEPFIEHYLNEARKRGPSDNDYLTKAFVQFFIKKDFQSAEKSLQQAMELSQNNSTVLYTYSYLLNMMGRFGEAIQFVTKAKSIDPLTVAYFNYQTICLYLLNRQEEAIETLKEGLQLYPSVLRFYDFLARIYLVQRRYIDAIEAVESGFRTTTIRPPSMVAYITAAYAGLQQDDKAKVTLSELITRSQANEKGVNMSLVYAYHGMGDESAAWIAYDKARKSNDVDLIWWNVDPLLKTLREQPRNEIRMQPDFQGAEEHIKDLLGREMPKLPYHNVSHIYDVLDASLKIADSEQLGVDDIKLLRVAALFHDAGFIRSAANHEEHGAQMAREILPTFGLNGEQIEKIASMIIATRIPQSPSSQLDKILCDADLDYLGRTDFYSIGGTLFEELKAAGVVETEREWNLVQKTFLQSHRYHTNFGKSNRESCKQERLKEINAKLNNR